ncbi:MAG: zinc-binding dehydrogenase [Acidimicrobiales bacterium]
MPTPSTMTAAVTFGHGGPEMTEVRTDWPVPKPDDGQALVRVTAAALNNTDIWSRTGAYGTPQNPDAVAGWRGVPLQFPRIQGIDVAGVVERVGRGVDPGWVGRRVLVDPVRIYRNNFPAEIIGSETDGGFAHYHLTSEAQLHGVTGSPLSDTELACLPTAYGTALGMINRAGCTSGERVVVTGSSGGVGSAAIQLLLARNCHVVARTSAEKADMVRTTGVAEVSVRDHDPIGQIEEVDAVVDVVGGDEFGELLDRLRDGGRMVTAGAIAGPVVPFDIRRLYLRQRTLIGSTMHTSDDFVELAKTARAGALRPIVGGTYPLSAIAEAQARFIAKDFVGKLVLEP